MLNNVSNEDIEKLNKVKEEVEIVLSDFCKENNIGDITDNHVSNCMCNIIKNINSIKIWSNQDE